MTQTEKPKLLRLGDVELYVAATSDIYDRITTLLTVFFSASEAWATITSIAEIIEPESTNRADFLAECRTGAFDGVHIIFRTAEAGPTLTGRVDGELLDALPSSLKFICHKGLSQWRCLKQAQLTRKLGAGYDQIDIKQCIARGISVSNTPTAVDEATADTAIWLMIGALRNYNKHLVSLRAGNWSGRGRLELGHDPQNKTLGILGMGGIGRSMAKKARAFDMKIQYHNRNRLSPEEEDGAEYVSFEKLLRDSDVLSLNLPLNVSSPDYKEISIHSFKSQANTRGIISTAEFEIMKPGIVIVNTARGAVMDEAALVAALESGQVLSVGLDVFENEPIIHPGLLSNERVLLLPHLGTATVETEKKMEEWALSNVQMAIEQGTLKSIVPEQRK